MRPATSTEVPVPCPAKPVAWEQYNAARTCTNLVYLRKRGAMLLSEQKPIRNWLMDPKNGCQGYFLFNYINGRSCIQCQCAATAVLIKMKWG